MKTFEEIELIPQLRRALADEQYRTPTPIQAQTIPPALLGKDILGCAQTGTGKTAAFALPILNRLGQRNRKAKYRRPFVLILAPTRELAIQIDQSFATYGKHLHLRRALVYGGVSQASQVRAMNRGAHILVATPGRLLDLMNQGFIHLDELEVFVLDEADRMLDMGFLPDLKRIIRCLPDQRQSLFFSATLPPKIVEFTQSLLRQPVHVTVTPETRDIERINQQVLFVEPSKKAALLHRLLAAPETDQALVFTKTKRGANVVAERLLRNGIQATAIHGNKSQAARQRALEAFRRRQVQVLVATDVAARGIDIDGISHVFNYDLPIEPEAYVHRIGRTGRAGATGIALSFCGPGERPLLRAIEQLIGHQLPASGEGESAGSKSSHRRSGQRRPHRKPTAHGARNPSSGSARKSRVKGNRPKGKRPQKLARP